MQLLKLLTGLVYLMMEKLNINQKELKYIKKYINQLLESGNAYKCYMSKEELDSLRAKQEAAKQTPRYDETWRPEDGKVLPTNSRRN